MWKTRRGNYKIAVALCDVLLELGYKGRSPLCIWADSDGMVDFPTFKQPEISVSQKIDAICEHLNLEIVKKTREEKIVCRWGSSAKPGPKKKEKK